MVVVEEGGMNAESRCWCFAVFVIAIEVVVRVVVVAVVVVGGG